MGKTRYGAFDKILTAKELLALLRLKKKVKRAKLLRFYYCQQIVDFKGLEVKLFFFKTSRKGNWNAVMTTNTKLTFEEVYKIYSNRWFIEVYFKEAKQYLGLGKCQAQDFDAQIASTTLCMMQYNILPVIKRFHDYETIGELFRASHKDAIKLTLAEQIWLIIIEIMSELSQVLDINTEMFMENLLSENETLTKYFNLSNLSQAG